MMLWLVNSRHADQSMICTGTQLLREKHKTEFSHVKPKEPIKMLDVFSA